MIDTHVHLLDPWRYPYPSGSKGYAPGPDEAGSLDDLIRVMDRHGVDHAVLVAASVYGPDNQSMLDAYASFSDRFRIIAGIDIHDLAAIDALASTPGIVGIRLNLTDDRAQSDATQLAKVLNAALASGLCVTIQASPMAAQHALRDAGEGPVILDHLGRPDLEGGMDTLSDIAKRPNTWLKLSGGFRIAGSNWPDESDLTRRVVGMFPSERLIWGSDWPFINTSDDRPAYAQCLAWASTLSTADFANNARNLFWGSP
ncbi:amidohydrolase family protein [Thiosulfatihalobacter marinus]|uniref:amidohydrolase family protein n=1 Tax=Thiosulfatihalobacter marinus TaxID=2792481 RepID=UPI0018D998FC|nr:amidohydrolase family protein [Thiosulfatihalobacter marinus]